MSEGHVYLCRWEKAEDGFRVWLAKRPKLRAEGESLDEALRELSSLVCLATGDGEAVFDLSPPRNPVGPEAFVTLGWNSRWSPAEGFSRGDYAALYEGGLCRCCCTGVGRRTKKPLSVGELGEGNLLGNRLRLPKVLLASERFRQLLTAGERAMLDWRPVEMRRKSRRIFFELAAKDPIKAVADRTRPVSGWHCPSCGNRLFSVFGDYENTYVAKSDMPKPSPSLLAIETPHLLKLATPLQRWEEIRGEPGTTSILSGQVVPLSARRAWRQPLVRTLTTESTEAINGELDYSLGPSQ